MEQGRVALPGGCCREAAVFGGAYIDKQALSQYQYLLKEIEQLEAEKQGLFGISASSCSGMPKGKGRVADLSGLVEKLDGLQRLIDERLDVLIGLRGRIEAAIAGLEPQERLLVRLRYMDGKGWDWIALDMSYSYRSVLRLHERVLRKLAGYGDGGVRG